MVEITKTLEDAGLGPIDRTALAGKITLAPNVRGMIGRLYSDPSIPDSNKVQVLEAVAHKYQSDPDVISKLETEFARDPSLVGRFETLARTNPSAVSSTIIPSYNGGNLSTLVTAAAPAAAPTTTPPAAAPTATPPAAAPTATPPAAAPTATPPAAAPTTTPPAAAPTTTPPAAAPTATPPAAAPVATAPAATTPATHAAFSGLSAADQELFKSGFTILADQDDRTISGAINRDFVRDMSSVIAEEAKTKFGVSEVAANGFATRLQNDTALQDKVVDNLKAHPDFVRQMAKSLRDGTEIPEAGKQLAQTQMTELMENPEKLADGAYIEKVTGMMKGGGMFNQISEMLKNSLGIDLSGMMGGMGAMFQGMVEWFKDFFGAFSGGGVKDFLSQPSNANLGMMDKLSASIGFALHSAGNTPHSVYENAAMVPIQADDQLFKTIKVKNEAGVEVDRRVPNTIEVTSVNGTKHNVVPTDLSQLEVERTDSGNYKVRVATDLEVDSAGSIKVTGSDQLYLAPEEYERLATELKKIKPGMQDPDIQDSPRVRAERAQAAQAQQPQTTIQVTRLDPQNGHVASTDQVFPQPEPAPAAPGSTASQDMDMMRRTAVNQASMSLIPGLAGFATD